MHWCTSMSMCKREKEKEDEITVANLSFTLKVINRLHLFRRFVSVFSLLSLHSTWSCCSLKSIKYLALVIIILTVYYQLDADNFFFFL